MGRTRIAPVLASLVARRDKGFGVYHPEAEMEFRALLAVARQAERVLLIEQGTAGATIDEDPDVFLPEEVKLWRLLRRLSRSGGGREGSDG